MLAEYSDSADSVLDAELSVVEDEDAVRMECATTVSSRIQSMAFMYKLTGDSKYLTRAVAEMDNAASFADWNPQPHFLDTASIMYGMAVGYDWLYQELTAEQRTRYEEAIYNKGIIPAYNQHVEPYCGHNWVANKTNWNLVCNSSVVVAALALADKDAYSEICIDTASRSLKAIVGAMDNFNDDGAWYEGPGYGQYGMGYFMPMTEVMRNSLGTDFGYMTHKGIKAYSDFIIQVTGANEVFNFGDGGEALTQSPTLGLYSRISGNNFYGAYRYAQIQNESEASVTMGDLLWYKPEFITYDVNYAPKDKLFPCIDTAVFRNSFTSDIAFAGIHGGYNNVTHGQLDAGSFVYDAHGVRFASDLGQDNYNLYGYFTTSANGGKNRWAYYRNRAEGHNTLVINPSSDPDQVPESQSDITKFHTDSAGGYAVVDMTGAYAGNASSAIRGFKFFRDTGALLIKDEVSLLGESDVYWFMHVPGGSNLNVSIADDGKSAVLTRWGSKIRVCVLGEGTLEITDATPFATSPNPDEWAENLDNAGGETNPKTQAANSWYKKLQIKLSGVSGDKDIAVYLYPTDANGSAPETLPELTDIANW